MKVFGLFWVLLIPRFIVIIYFLATLFYIIISILKREKLNFNVVKVNIKGIIIVPIIAVSLIAFGTWLTVEHLIYYLPVYSIYPYYLIALVISSNIFISALYLALKLSKSNKIQNNS